MSLQVYNIQRFSLQDGPGIRTTLFFSGCQIHCPWCANPELLNYDMQETTVERIARGKKINYTLQEIEKEVLKDDIFYENSGGITYSGGEPLAFKKSESERVELLKRLTTRGIHTCIETSLFSPIENLMALLEYTSLFLVDVKILDSKQCWDVLGGNLDVFYRNLDVIKKAEKPFVFRVPLAVPYTANKENIIQLLNLITKYKPLSVELFGVHHLAEKKYLMLGEHMKEYTSPLEYEILKIRDVIRKLHIPVKVIRF